jgi:hypothetical protein
MINAVASVDGDSFALNGNVSRFYDSTCNVKVPPISFSDCDLVQPAHICLPSTLIGMLRCAKWYVISLIQATVAVQESSILWRFI